MSYHKTIIKGNIGNTPELRYTPSGQPVCSFSVAVNERFTRSTGEQVDNTIWYRVSAWGRLAEVCGEYLEKGQEVLIDGQLQADNATGGPRIWGDPPKASYELRASTVDFGRKNGGANDAAEGEPF